MNDPTLYETYQRIDKIYDELIRIAGDLEDAANAMPGDVDPEDNSVVLNKELGRVTGMIEDARTEITDLVG